MKTNIFKVFQYYRDKSEFIKQLSGDEFDWKFVAFIPIVIFFMITGGNYYFLQLLHIAIMAFASIFGMKLIIEALKYNCENEDIYPKTGVTIFRIWIVIFLFVSIQLGWNLRPFIVSTQRNSRYSVNMRG